MPTLSSKQEARVPAAQQRPPESQLIRKHQGPLGLGTEVPGSPAARQRADVPVGPGGEDVNVEFNAKLGLHAQSQSAWRSPGREPHSTPGHTRALRQEPLSPEAGLLGNGDCVTRSVLRTGRPAPGEHNTGKKPLRGNARESAQRGALGLGLEG